MRIIGDIPHSALKITVFKMDNRITIKFENPQLEQSYKFGISDQLQHFEDVKKLVDENFISDVLTMFKNQLHTQIQALDRFVQKEEHDEFEDII